MWNFMESVLLVIEGAKKDIGISQYESTCLQSAKKKEQWIRVL